MAAGVSHPPDQRVLIFIWRRRNGSKALRSHTRRPSPRPPQLSLVRKVGAHIKVAIEHWSLENPSEFSPTPDRILSVVSFAMSSLPLDPRLDLLEGGVSGGAVFGGEDVLGRAARALMEGYRGGVSVLPSTKSGV